jgi:HD-like signal output (HDOD) protein/ActR/RegA family two-component response regulator
MKRILFVATDTALLAALRAMLAPQRARWDMVHVPTAAAALAQLEAAEFDALICDLSMPGTDAPQLLNRAQQRHPNMVRLCLSDTLEGDTFLRAVPLAHQFLSKPCHADTLFEVVERTCAVREILGRPAIRTLVGRLAQLPSTPQTFKALSEAIAEPNAHSDRIAEIVSQDQALSVKTLQIVNSALFRRTSAISSIHAAVAFVGLEMIKSLALSACMFSALESAPAASRLLKDLQVRSMRRAQFARMLLEGSRYAQEAFTAALLLDIGEAVLALGNPEQFQQMIALAQSRGQPWYEVEPEIFGAAHPEVGAYLLGLWGLPIELIEAVAYHHRPSQVAHRQTDVLLAIHVADAVTRINPENPGNLMDRLDPEFVARPDVALCIKSWMLDPEPDLGLAQDPAA